MEQVNLMHAEEQAKVENKFDLGAIEIKVQENMNPKDPRIQKQRAEFDKNVTKKIKVSDENIKKVVNEARLKDIQDEMDAGQPQS